MQHYSNFTKETEKYRHTDSLQQSHSVWISQQIQGEAFGDLCWCSPLHRILPLLLYSILIIHLIGTKPGYLSPSHGWLLFTDSGKYLKRLLCTWLFRAIWQQIEVWPRSPRNLQNLWNLQMLLLMSEIVAAIINQDVYHLCYTFMPSLFAYRMCDDDFSYQHHMIKHRTHKVQTPIPGFLFFTSLQYADILQHE